MRLMHASTYETKYFIGNNVPQYAILSHTWEGDEVTLQDLATPGLADKKPQGYRKIMKCCEQAVEDGIEWVWIDSCCIDKTSSAELSEAINSMYRWYKRAFVCYAYLSDAANVLPNLSPESFMESRWFTRGWTLQELIAPSRIEFYSGNWTEIGTKRSLVTYIHQRTTIPIGVLLGDQPPTIHSAARRLSWAANRETTREEDIAYCLLGLFDINMPLLYGEGSGAFSRLQEQILRATGDLSLLLWSANSRLTDSDMPYSWSSYDSFLAPAPKYFESLYYVNNTSTSTPLSSVHRADWSRVYDLYNNSVAESMESVAFNPRGLQVYIPTETFARAVDVDDEYVKQLLWPQYYLFKEDHKSVLGMVCVHGLFSVNNRSQVTRIGWQVKLISADRESDFSGIRHCLCISQPNSHETVQASAKLGMQLKTDVDHFPVSLVTKTCGTRPEWNIEIDSFAPGNVIVRRRPQGFSVKLPRKGRDRPLFCAGLRLRLRSSVWGAETETFILIVRVTDRDTWCALRPDADGVWYGYEEWPEDTSDRDWLVIPPITHSRVSTPGGNIVVNVAAKFRYGALEYQVSAE